jgi:nucleoside-diphosphate-sugar epimerase
VAERALVTGGAGFIGAHLVARLLADGVDVTIVDDFSRGPRDAVVADLARHARLVQHDLTRPLTDARGLGPVDAVYHLAAVVGVGNVELAPGHVLWTNLTATLNVLSWCRAQPPERLFLSSTSEITDGAAATGLARYPTRETDPYVLTDPFRPRSSYALSKVASEVLFVHLSGESSVRIARYHNVFGPRMGTSHVIPQMIQRLLQGDDPFAIYGSGHSRAFCYVTDAVHATVLVMALPDAEPILVNIGDDREEITCAALAEKLFALAGRWPAVTDEPAPAGAAPRRLPALDELRRRVGYEPTVGLDQGLKATFDWYVARSGVQA